MIGKTLFIAGTASAMITFGTCPDVSNSMMQNLDLSKLEGNWYPTLSDPDFVNGFNIDCSLFNLSKTADGKTESYMTQINKWGKLTLLSIESEISETGPARGTDFLFNQKYSYYLADTDYSSYLIAYMCEEIDEEEDLEENELPLRLQLVDIILRNPDASEEEINRIKEIAVKKLGIGKGHLEDYNLNNLTRIKQGAKNNC